MDELLQAVGHSRAASNVRNVIEPALYLSPGLVLYLGPELSARSHRHHAVQLAWGLERPLSLDYGERRVDAPAVLVPSGVGHALESPGPTLVALVEPDGSRGTGLQQRAVELEGEDVHRQLAGALPLPDEALGVDELISWAWNALARLGARRVEQQRSEVVDTALAFIEAAIGGSVRLEQAAEVASVSPSRLTHLFSAEVGLPFRRYVLWARLRRAVEAVREGENLTQAAISAGFSDSAHLTRTFKETFGLPPSQALSQMRIAGRLWSQA